MSLDHKASNVKPSVTSFDNFLGAKLNIEQPLNGFRSGIDAVLLGSSVKNTQGHLLELGSGVGVASLTALINNQKLNATLVDVNEEIIILANNNIARNKVATRAKAIKFDILSPASKRKTANIKHNFYSHIIANPPFFYMGTGTLPDEKLRSNARHMNKSNLDIWIRMAASCACSGGEVIFIYKADGLNILLQSFAKRFGNIKILPIISRLGQSAKKIMISGILGSRAPLKILSPLILHQEKGRDFLPEIEQVFRGEKMLHW